ncbi:gas vesicle protein K [Actinomadura spongiicola]|uniref:Gas vesicle protein K n=1 Tax=Actinomadura spongiicola TaxID=2303421 RepID=A0A372GEN7_9ACTN|nr:gas vesicle protein K [Actinomadura spongiicola]RFS83841.1 gas vesicle protein K [Actinomadura spongiicola]
MTRPDTSAHLTEHSSEHPPGHLFEHTSEPSSGPSSTHPFERPSPTLRRLHTDPETVERDLVKLVLTLVELIRQLMERQALRRAEGGDLTDEQIEALGLALMRLDEAMTRLKDHFGLDDHDLNLDLGPLGPLLPD